MKYLSKLDAKFLLDFGKNFFKTNYNCDNIYIEKIPNSCIIKCFLSNKQTLILSLKDFDVKSNCVLCGILAKTQWQKELAKHYGEPYLIDLKEHLSKDVNKEHNKNVSRVDFKINKLKEEFVR